MMEAQGSKDAFAVPHRGRVKWLGRLNGLTRLSFLAATLTLSFLLRLPAFAVETSVQERIKDVVEQQLQAFQADDGVGAYALASPNIHQMFPSPDVFMGMVRQGYPPVYRSRAHTFGESREVEGGLEQVVRLEDTEGVGWTAVYTLERQPDGSWAISGCRLVRAPDQAV